VISESKRVLIVDDDPDIQQLIRLLLARIGVDSMTAGTATEAARLLRTPPLPDLIILDLMLPEINGVEFLRQMRAKSLFEDVPVMVLSALIDSEHIREALDAGADRYLTKPYIASNLTTIVLDMLRTGRRVRNG
jgi:DNA-binding response OmpR family regulator